jgi:glucose-1-phosphate cytidylyltransferase
MKVVILAGGLGTRLSEETMLKPKPLVEIGDMPILWHIMKHYSYYGFNEFLICCGYKGYLIKEFFVNYSFHASDITVDISSKKIETHSSNLNENWKVTLVDTGENTLTGGRLKRIYPYLENDSDFLMTYGDGVSNININNLLKFHKSQKTLATVSAVKPPARFGYLNIAEESNLVGSFEEKNMDDQKFINGGFFVLSPKVLNYIDSDMTSWELEPLKKLSKEKNLSAYRHNGFWHPMDTLRDKNYLNNLWLSNSAPWKLW